MEYIIDKYQNLLDWPITEKELMDKDTDKYINQNVCLCRRFPEVLIQSGMKVCSLNVQNQPSRAKHTT